MAETLDEVRRAIDEIDDLIVQLLARRQAWVVEAARFKTTAEEVAASDRVADVIARVHVLAERHGADPAVVEATFHAIIAGFISLEQREVDNG